MFFVGKKQNFHLLQNVLHGDFGAFQDMSIECLGRKKYEFTKVGHIYNRVTYHEVT